MSSLDLFMPLEKVDLDQRMVYGVATAEAPDRSGEICDYSSSKPYFAKWSQEALAASGGKSLGAVRAMHGRVAAGKLTDLSFDDDNKRIRVAAKIVDDDEWLKVTEGVYTGFSQGGRYVKRWPDAETGLTRYTAEPREISLVDLPCLPNATFEVVKDGVVEKRSFVAAQRPIQETDATAAEAAPEQTATLSESRPTSSTETPLDARTEGAREALAKAAAALSLVAEKLERAMAENSTLRKSLAELSPALSELTKRVAALEAQPLPAKAALRAIVKTADGNGETSLGAEDAIKRLASLPPQERALALTKLSLANPTPLRF
jgi:hypothetical protein